MAYFQLQLAESELQQLAEKYWHEAGERERQLEAAAYEAEKRSGAVNTLFLISKPSFAGSRSGWCIT